MPAIFKRYATAASLLAALSLAACSGSGTSPVSATQENLGANVLQLAVGTANIYGTSTGLNVVATYRQPHGAFHPGDSAVAVLTPTFGGPSALPANPGAVGNFFSTVEAGPAPIELGTHNMTGTPQTQTGPTTFGTAGTVSGLGIEPFGYNNQNGSPASIVPYTQPLYDPNNPSFCSSSGCTPDPNVFVPWGGPPAFPNVRNSSNAGQQGYEEGLDVFMGVTPAKGPYTLTVTVTPQNAAVFTTSKSAAMGSPGTVLPAVTPPTPTLDGQGGGTFHVALTGGITEAYVQVVDLGPPASSFAGCNGSSLGGPTYYTLLLRPGANTGTLGDSLGVGGSPSLCTAAQNAAANPSGKGVPGDNFSVQVLGFDYPWFEASYPQSNGNPAPTIAGGSGQSDISISLQAACSQTATVAVACTLPAASRARRHR